jgi:menaquinol-cytochrome c reductase iron-sulfur subunit
MAESTMGKFDATRETASGGAARGGLAGGNAATGSATAGGSATETGGRRGFLVRLMAVVIGGLVTVFPFAAGLLVFADPWRRQVGGARLARVAMLDDVPYDGIPRLFSVSENQIDAWNYYPNQPVGAVYLRRANKDANPEALQATCPHAGCMVEFVNTAHVFKCPCHNSSFDADGQTIQPSPAPRPMDTLDCKVIDGAVFVEYQNFYTGSADKIPKV